MAPMLELTQTIDAPIERIWRAALFPEGLANWQADRATGRAELGGSVELAWPKLGARLGLEIAAWDPPHHAQLRHDDTLVDLHFTPGAVRLAQRGPTLDPLGLRSSWSCALAQLAHYVERHPGRERRVEWMLETVTAPPELIYLALTEPNLRARWLSDPAAESRELGGHRDEYTLSLRAGPSLSGRVLANTVGRDVLVSCSDVSDATLAFRTLPAPTLGGRIVAFTWSEWGAPSELGRSAVRALRASLPRLSGVLSQVARS